MRTVPSGSPACARWWIAPGPWHWPSSGCCRCSPHSRGSCRARAFDVVLCGLDHAPSAAEARRLTARARERGAVLVVVGGRTAGAGPARRAWPGVADVELTVGASEWSGIGAGRGRLVHRRLSLQVGGRRGADRPRRADLWFPGPSGIELVRDDMAAPGASGVSSVPAAAATSAGPHLRRVG